MRQAIAKWIVVGVLVLTVAGLIVWKTATRGDQSDKVELVQPVKQDAGTIPVEETGSEAAKTSAADNSEVLASVNSRQMTEMELEAYYQSLPDEYKSAYKNNKEGLLDQLIVEEVLYQEAVRRGYAENGAKTVDPEKKMSAIRRLIDAVTEKTTVTEKEIREFYDTHPTEVQGASYDQIKDGIKDYLIGQKQNEIVDRLIVDLKQKAQITVNQDWLAKQAALKPQNPLTKAMKSGKPTVLDLGAGTCIPCKMMKPIFEELEKEYQGRANIILLEIDDYCDLAAQYQVRVIPTQIFFDKQGKQVWRHEGFLAKEEIVNKLRKLGAE